MSNGRTLIGSVNKASARSRVTNGRTMLPGIDGRGAWARRAKDLFALHLSDLGGTTAVSEAERSIVRRCAIIETELERLEFRFAEAGEASAKSLDLYARTSGNLRRLFESVGIRRRAKDITHEADQMNELLGFLRDEPAEAAP